LVALDLLDHVETACPCDGRTFELYRSTVERQYPHRSDHFPFARWGSRRCTFTQASTWIAVIALVGDGFFDPLGDWNARRRVVVVMLRCALPVIP
jgi:hypothetical protein